VLTTTARSPSEDWGTNRFPAGETLESGVRVHRFRVERRDHDAFDRANSFFLSQPLGQRRLSLPKAHVDSFIEQNISSKALLAHLHEHGPAYDASIFLPYLYGPTLAGLPLVRERAWLQPCLHHECYAFVPQVASVFHQAKGLLFNSDGEYELALRLYGPGIRDKSYVVGEWIDEPLQAPGTGRRVGTFAPARERYALYLGRRDETKNVGLLIESFLLYRRQEYATTLKLVLAGAGNTSYHDETHGVVDLGVVSESQRDLLIDHCLALFQPSYNESFSRVVMEAWSRERPVAVNAQCISTAQAVRRSEGGWLATTKGEWADVMRLVDTLAPAQLAALGRRGNEYYRRTATREGVMERYETAMRLRTRPQFSTARVYHLVPSLDLVEDVTRRALTVDEWLRGAHCATTIDAQPRNRGPLPDDAVLTVHSPLPEDLERAAAFAGDVALFYDAGAFEGADDGVRALVPNLSLAFATDERSAEVLRNAGARDVEVLPFVVGMRCWDVDPDPDVIDALDDGRVNCLFAGRLDETSCCEQLIEALAFLLSLEVDARLVIVGMLDPTLRYHAGLLTMIAEYKLQDRVRFIASTDAGAVAAAYRMATLFWSMSEGRNSLCSFVDAMWFDVPILAYASECAAPLLDQGGLLFTTKDDLLRTAALAKLLVDDASLRARLITAQEERRAAFVPEPMPGYARLERLTGRVGLAAG
jgi:glycosyltransferase involved in cell wall biosynthesis